MSFRIIGLPAEPFAPLFAMSEAELTARKAARRVADASSGFPCRIGLRDADEGEEVILVNYQHQPAPTPYQASHAIYVARGSTRAFDAVDQVPAQLRRRRLSLRAFDADAFMIDASLADGADLETAVEAALANPRVAYIQAHFAAFGCYAARIERT